MPHRWRKPAIFLLFTAYFLFVSWDGLKAPFAADDLQAIHTYWHPSLLRLLVSQFMLWRGYWRPMVGIFYLPIFRVWGLNPAPYHVLLLLLLWIGAWQLYRFARALGSGELAAAGAALIACYHGGIANLYYNTVYVGDVLCGIFYWAAFAHYAQIRSAGRLLSRAQTAAFLALYLCALNSKEIAATLPVMLLAYEWLYHGLPPLRWKELIGWLRGPGRVLCLAGMLNVVYIFGKAFGPYGLMKNPAYRPLYSWARMVDFQERYLSNIFYQVYRLDGWAIGAIWLAVTYWAWRRKRPILRFCWIYVVVAPLPIEFLIGRDQANLYVTLAGWAVLAATLFVDWLPAAVRVLSGEPLLRRLSQPRLRGLLAAAGMIAVAWGTWSFKEKWVVPAIPKLSPLTAEVLAEFRRTNPQVPPGATVIFLDDPWPGGFDMSFIAQLWFRDRKAHVYLNRQQPMTPFEILNADALFSWQDGKLVRVVAGYPTDSAPPGHYDDFDLRVRFFAQWVRNPHFPSAANGSISYSDAPDAAFQFAFRGSAVTWVYTKAPNRGLAEAFVDGRPVGQVDLYASENTWQSRTEFAGLGGGEHLLEVKVLGRKTPQSSGTFVDLDELIVQ